MKNYPDFKYLWTFLRPTKRQFLYRLYNYITMTYRSWPLPTLDGKKIPDGTRCPYCWRIKIVKHGKTSAGNQRYRCLSLKCSKTFACWSKRKRVYTEVFKTNVILYFQLRSYGWLRATAKAVGIAPNTIYRRLPKYYDPSLPWPLKRYDKRFSYPNP